MIIDTEAHVLRFARSYHNNPQAKRYRMNRHYTWYEHPSELLVTEMDVAGVDKVFLLSYDAEDTAWSAQQWGYTFEDFSGGRKHTLIQASKYPDRFLWFNTVKDPKIHDSAALIRADASIGMVGIKLFPGYIKISLTEDAMKPVFDACQELGLRVLISFETLRPPQTKSLPEYFVELDELLGRYPEVNFALLHNGCADPLTGAADPIFEMIAKHSNLYLSTSMPGEVWEDGTEYPYANYLKRMESICTSATPERVMWATDWPWFDWAYKYEQALNSIKKHASFLSESEKALVLGGAAERFIGDKINVQVTPNAEIETWGQVK